MNAHQFEFHLPPAPIDAILSEKLRDVERRLIYAGDVLGDQVTEAYAKRSFWQDYIVIAVRFDPDDLLIIRDRLVARFGRPEKVREFGSHEC